jgi:hypothetical protein
MSVDALVNKVTKLDYARILAVKGISLFPGGAALSGIADALFQRKTHPSSNGNRSASMPKSWCKI